tara:strand:+ start:79 stop:300 length:222 start_codon:yes stop_codon:yes gene_type:complete
MFYVYAITYPSRTNRNVGGIMKLQARTEIAKKLLKGKEHIELDNNTYEPINNILLWCSETNNDFKTNFELLRG